MDPGATRGRHPVRVAPFNAERLISNINVTSSELQPHALFKVECGSRGKLGDAICIQDQGLVPNIVIYNCDSTFGHYEFRASPHDSESLDRANHGELLPNKPAGGTMQAMVEAGCEFKHTWQQSPLRAVCWFHQHKPGKIMCTITDRNFCSKSCYLAAFYHVKKIISSCDRIKHPAGINPMTRGVIAGIGQWASRTMDILKEHNPEVLNVLRNVGHYRISSPYDCIPRLPISWPAPTSPFKRIALNMDLCDGVIKDCQGPFTKSYSEFFESRQRGGLSKGMEAGGVMHSRHQGATLRSGNQRAVTNMYDPVGKDLWGIGSTVSEAWKLQAMNKGMNPLIINGTGGISWKVLWEYYRQLRANQIAFSPEERKTIAWKPIAMGNNKDLTPTESHIGRVLKFRTSLVKRPVDHNAVRILNSPEVKTNSQPYAPVVVKEILRNCLEDENSIDKLKNTVEVTTSVCVPTWQRAQISGVLTKISSANKSPDVLNNPNVHLEEQQGFSVLSWNILAEIYSTEEMFHHLSPAYLKWNHRRHYILTQIIQLSPDIVCLQEMQNDHFTYLAEKLDLSGYGGFYKHKKLDFFTGGGSDGAGVYVGDGCAIFYRLSKFKPVLLLQADYASLISQLVVDLGGLAKLEHMVSQLNDGYSDRVITGKDITARLFKDNVFQILSLECREGSGANNEYLEGAKQYHQKCIQKIKEVGNSSKKVLDKSDIEFTRRTGSTTEEFRFTENSECKGKMLMIANTHILANPEVSDTKFWQTALFMNNVDKALSTLRLELLSYRMQTGLGRGLAGSLGNKVKTTSGYNGFRVGERNVDLIEPMPQVAVIICGDFNSMPGSAVYSYLINGRADPYHPELVNDKRGLLKVACNLPRLNHTLRLKSMNAEGICEDRGVDMGKFLVSADEQNYLKSHRNSLGLTEPVWTNCTPLFMGCLDYVMYEYKEIVCQSVLRLPSQFSLSREAEFTHTLSPHLPMLNRPSDHVPIYGQFKWRLPDTLPDLSMDEYQRLLNIISENRTNSMSMVGAIGREGANMGSNHYIPKSINPMVAMNSNYGGGSSLSMADIT